MKTLFSIVAVIAVAVQVEAAGAQTDNQDAKDYFQQATEQFATGDYEKAVVYFRKANELKSSWKLWFNIGQAEAACRNYGRALEAFEKYLALGGDNIATARFDEVVAEMRRLRELVGNIIIAGGPPDAMVLVDGVSRAELPLNVELRVAAGIPHTIEIVDSNAIIHRQTVTVGSTSSVTINLADESNGRTSTDEIIGPVETDTIPVETEPAENTESAKEAVSKDPALRPIRISLITTLGLAVVTGGLGVGFGVAAGKKETELDQLNDEFDNFQITDAAYDQNFDDINSKMNSYDRVATAMLISSGVLALGSVVLAVVYARKRNLRSEKMSLNPSGCSTSF